MEPRDSGFWNDKWLDEMTLDMVKSGLQYQIAETIGMSSYLRLCKLINGDKVYIPEFESVITPLRNKKIKEEFNGYNHKELAKKYGLTPNWIRQICGEGWLKGQQTLFD